MRLPPYTDYVCCPANAKLEKIRQLENGNDNDDGDDDDDDDDDGDGDRNGAGGSAKYQQRSDYTNQ